MESSVILLRSTSGKRHSPKVAVGLDHFPAMALRAFTPNSRKLPNPALQLSAINSKQDNPQVLAALARQLEDARASENKRAFFRWCETAAEDRQQQNSTFLNSTLAKSPPSKTAKSLETLTKRKVPSNR